MDEKFFLHVYNIGIENHMTQENIQVKLSKLKNQVLEKLLHCIQNETEFNVKVSWIIYYIH